MSKVLANHAKIPKNTMLYGGALDIANAIASRQLVSDLKFGALLYRHIVVPDGFFHCRGPLFDVLRAPEGVFADTILGLLRDGVIVPGLRVGESLAENFRAGRDATEPNGYYGIKPGKFMIVDFDEGFIPLQRADQAAKYVIPWPGAMPDATKTQYASKLIEAYELEIDGPAFLHPRLRVLDPARQNVWISARNTLAEGLRRQLELQKTNPDFRRGTVERWLGRQLGIEELKSYAMIEERRNVTTDDGLLSDAASYLLDLSSTVYESYQADHFNTIGALFPRHHRRVTLQSVYQHFGDRQREPHDLPMEPVAAPHEWSFANVSLADIRAFRDGWVFGEHIERLRFLQQPPGGTRFEDIPANAAFINHFVTRVVPALLKIVPTRAGAYVEIGLNAITEMVTEDLPEELRALGRTVFRSVAGLAKEPVRKGLDPLLNRRLADAWIREQVNRYAAWPRLSADAAGIDADGREGRPERGVD